ncbi:hypothetical protein FrEUN1fDRAFT_2011 [Parafrankia sp. EUN1f]|nr:hypothetical protein FrEUN1fDRAFT_2011 [Parafrankia sp. EUN1f]
MAVARHSMARHPVGRMRRLPFGPRCFLAHCLSRVQFACSVARVIVWSPGWERSSIVNMRARRGNGTVPPLQYWSTGLQYWSTGPWTLDRNGEAWLARAGRRVGRRVGGVSSVLSTFTSALLRTLL